MGLLVLLIFGVLGIVLGELGVDAGCDGILGVEGTFGVAAIGGIMCEPLMAVR